VKLYHATSRAAAAAICERGFRDAQDPISGLTGAWFADRWIEWGSHWEAAVTIEIPNELLAPHEVPVGPIERLNGTAWVPADDEEPFRVFLLSADLANRYPVQLAVDEP
jgi:hypothetical protein